MDRTDQPNRDAEPATTDPGRAGVTIAPSELVAVNGPPAGPHSIAQDALNFVRGFLMGAADTVPGVSGGTVALILGHYQRLVTAISHVDATLVAAIRAGRFRAAAAHLDLRFLLLLGIGIAAGIVLLAGAMHELLDHQLPGTLAVFLGLILASVWIVRRQIETWNVATWVAFAAGVLIAAVISVIPSTGGDVSLPYLFLSGAIAICAMILPGISGAFVLLLLGVYHSITGVVKDAARGDISLSSLLKILVFAAGCLIGLISFSKLLRWLLATHHGATMAALLGLMVGSVGRLWPLQRPTADTQDLELKYRRFEYVSPLEWDGSLFVLGVLVVVAAAVVLLLEWVATAIDPTGGTDQHDGGEPTRAG